VTATIRTLVVDDEPLARQGLRVRLSREPDIEVVGEAEDGPGAIDAILKHRPDLVFLDIQMPGLDGFEVLSRTAAEHLPNVVFVTAYDQFALRAFAVHALDYLLKPIAHRRFQDALARARATLARQQESASADRLRELLEAREGSEESGSGGREDPERTGTFARRITVRDGERFLLVRTSDIDWVDAAGNYLQLHAGARTFQVRMTMAELERRLNPAEFARIHRSTVVNLDRIASIDPDWHGEYQVVLTTGVKLRLSRGYRHRLL
jgi:two-component system LytT family response regulator